jgi:isoquinoline 1-oxidoreductase beta subunit
MKEDLKKHALSQRSGGNADGVFERAEKNKIEAIYETPYEAHACMEPLTCTANVQEIKLRFGDRYRGPDWIQRDICGRLKLDPENVKVNMTFLGGGLAEKHLWIIPMTCFAFKRNECTCDRLFGQEKMI